MFANKKLQDELFCVREERNFFESRYTESVSEIQSLKTELQQAKQEIQRLRTQVLQQSGTNLDMQYSSPTKPNAPRSSLQAALKEIEPCASSLTGEEGDFDDDNDNLSETSSQDDARNIRHSAEKLLQWASYRSSMVSPRASAAIDGEEEQDGEPAAAAQPIGALIGKDQLTFDSDPEEDDEGDEPYAHHEEKKEDDRDEIQNLQGKFEQL